MYAKKMFLACTLTALLSSQAFGQAGPVDAPASDSDNPRYLSFTAIENVLRQRDGNLRVTKTKDGYRYLANIRHDGWNYSIDVEVYKNNIWLACGVSRPFSSLSDIPQDVMANILKESFVVGPTHFALVRLSSGSHRIQAARWQNRECSAAELNNQVIIFLSHVRRTYPLWRTVANGTSSNSVANNGTSTPPATTETPANNSSPVFQGPNGSSTSNASNSSFERPSFDRIR